MIEGFGGVGCLRHRNGIATILQNLRGERDVLNSLPGIGSANRGLWALNPVGIPMGMRCVSSGEVIRRFARDGSLGEAALPGRRLVFSWLSSPAQALLTLR